MNGYIKSGPHPHSQSGSREVGKPYYQEAGITIYHGDCREVLPGLPPADLIFTSPPYNLGNTDGYLGHGGQWHRTRSRPDRKWSGSILWDGYGEQNDNLPWSEYEQTQRDILRLCWGALGPAGAIYYNHRPRVRGTDLWTPLMLNPGLPIRQIIIWARAGGMNCSPTYYMPSHEWLILFAKPKFRLRDGAASAVGDLWYVPQEPSELHPAPFPIGLPLRALETTRPGLVLDPFCGSGTTLRAAKDCNRQAIGIEIEERYCEIAARRLSQGVLDLAEPLSPCLQ